MTRLELLKIVVGRARANGFEFRRWYVTRLGLPWISADAALVALETQRRYYSLLFSHDFARSFWKAGEEITFTVAARSFERVMPDGSVGTVSRKPYVRRSARRDAWRYHLQQMALAEEPLRYIRKYLHVADDLEDDLGGATDTSLLNPGAAPEPPARSLQAVGAPANSPDAMQPRPATRSRKSPQASIKPPTAVAKTLSAHRAPRTLPTDLPAFLKRPLDC